MRKQSGQSTLEWVITAAVVLGTLVVGIVAPNQGRRPRWTWLTLANQSGS